MRLRLTFFFFVCFPFFALAQNALLIPPTLSGAEINLTLQNGTFEFFPGVSTNTMGANGNILGPTLILHKGEFVQFAVENQIGEPTTIHWHGMHVAPENDGGPHTVIEPGATWMPGFTVLDKAATYWYHPHLHMKTNEHVSKGIAGMIIVKDEEEAALNLPRTYGVDDFPIVIQTKDFDAEKQIVVPSNSDDVVMVNATIDPVLEVPAQVVRLRLLNGSSMRVFNIGLSENRTFYQIASDGGLLNSPLPLTRLQMGPGERAEILIDFSGMENQSVYLMSYASELPNGIYGAANPGMMAFMSLDGYQPNPLNGADFNILQLDVVAPTENPVLEILSNLVEVTPIPEVEANITRELVFTPASPGPNQLNGDFFINGVFFDMDVINYTIPLGNTEIWSIFNQSAIAHPFHIHDVQFYVLDRNGNPPPASEQGLKDVILIRPMETVRFITRFEDFANEDVPYMYHCHMLYHEDRGMMGQFLVVDESLDAGEPPSQRMYLYPNPFSSGFVLSGAAGAEAVLCDLSGRILKTQRILSDEEVFDLGDYPSGLYCLKVLSSGHTQVFKVVKK